MLRVGPEGAGGRDVKHWLKTLPVHKKDTLTVSTLLVGRGDNK